MLLLLLMVAVQAYNDGIGDILSDRVSDLVMQMYEAGELPQDATERIRSRMEAEKAGKTDEPTDDPLPSSDVEELDIRNSEREPSGVASADA